MHKLKFKKVIVFIPILISMQHVNLHMNMGSAIVWNVFLANICHIFTLGFPRHKFGTHSMRITLIYISLAILDPPLTCSSHWSGGTSRASGALWSLSPRHTSLTTWSRRPSESQRTDTPSGSSHAGRSS